MSTPATQPGDSSSTPPASSPAPAPTPPKPKAKRQWAKLILSKQGAMVVASVVACVAIYFGQQRQRAVSAQQAENTQQVTHPDGAASVSTDTSADGGGGDTATTTGRGSGHQGGEGESTAGESRGNSRPGVSSQTGSVSVSEAGGPTASRPRNNAGAMSGPDGKSVTTVNRRTYNPQRADSSPRATDNRAVAANPIQPLAGSPASAGGDAHLREVIFMEFKAVEAKATATKAMPSATAAQQRGAASSTSADASQPRGRHPEDVVFAPYGRSIKCELVGTVDSINLDTPIIGIVMEDVYWNGKLVVPVGTEVHSKATNTPTRDRIGSNGKWTLVLPRQGRNRSNGRELVLSGVLLDRDERVPLGQTYGITDMSAGMRGRVLKSTATHQEIQMFVGTFLSEVSKGVKETLQTKEAAPGLAGMSGQTIPQPTARNAVIGGVGSGTSGVMELWVKQIYEELKKNGSYVRVPAGHQFYVYVTQTIVLDDAKVGAHVAAREGAGFGMNPFDDPFSERKRSREDVEDERQESITKAYLDMLRGANQ